MISLPSLTVPFWNLPLRVSKCNLFQCYKWITIKKSRQEYPVHCYFHQFIWEGIVNRHEGREIIIIGTCCKRRGGIIFSRVRWDPFDRLSHREMTWDTGDDLPIIFFFSPWCFPLISCYSHPLFLPQSSRGWSVNWSDWALLFKIIKTPEGRIYGICTFPPLINWWRGAGCVQ